MRKVTFLFIAMGLVLIGCIQDSTRNKVYSSSWDGIPVVVEQINNNGDYIIINEIADATIVNRLIKALRRADWEENFELDTRLPDYRFTWNSFNHNVWLNETTGHLHLTIDERSNFTTLSKDSSRIVFEILTVKQLKDN